MPAKSISPSKVHHGRNIKRLREMLGIKQETLAMGLDMSQQNISLLEQRETIDDKMLTQVADVLNITTEAIKNMSDEVTTNYISTFTGNDHGHFFSNNFNYDEKATEKILDLYEQLLKAERDKVRLLERLLAEKDVDPMG